MTETFRPHAGWGSIGSYTVGLEDRITETVQIGRARIKCCLCGSILRPTRETLMAEGVRCKCGAIDIPARPDPCRNCRA